MDNETLRKLQLVEIELLKDFDVFCKKYDLKYSIYSGTLLGAVRHGGFIPWDDDVDVFMERNEYERFLKLWRENPVEGYYLQGTDSPDYEFINFSKIRKCGTKFGTSLDVRLYGEENVGIYLDVFPFDKVPTDKKKRKKFLFKAKLRMVYTRGYPFTKGSAFLKLLSKILLIPSRKRQIKIRNKLEKQIIDGCKDMTCGYEYMSLAASENFKTFYPAEVIENLSTIKFEDETFSAVKDYDKMLTIQYGDYMKLPPEDQQVCKHDPEVLDFGE